ncbi:unnamed protein product [Litomosoides sigmodontis]|uniref:Uncharacterized protein n=1 Tax=Litomosoides sigmodontis TaxID=42156 RepID=A0A3P6UGS4_LITSI|nr:unnamed protein product [Litomosoides sigmodontis]
MESAKLLFSLQLFTNNDKFIGSADIKLSAQLDVNVFCTSENPPIHNLIFGSEKTVALNHAESQLSLQTARALPSGSGLIPALRSVKCILSWQLPKQRQTWDTVESAKLLIFIRIYTETGKLLAKDITKYIVKPSMDYICTLDDVPTHQIFLISEKLRFQSKANSPIRRLTSEKEMAHARTIPITVTKVGSSSGISAAEECADSEIVWKTGVICCVTVMSFLIFKNQ